MARIPPLINAIFAEADLIAPNRDDASDGALGDAAHAARKSDHNPDSRGIVHAVDLDHDPGGGFDAHGEGEQIRLRCKHGLENRVKYLVSNDGRSDILASPNTGWEWKRQSGDAHRSHLHISIYSGVAVENSTAPMFRPIPGPNPPPGGQPAHGGSSGGDDMPSVLPVILPVAKASIQPQNGRVAHFSHTDTAVICWNNARLAGDQPFSNKPVGQANRDVAEGKTFSYILPALLPGMKIVGLSYFILPGGKVDYGRIVAYANNGHTYIFEST